MAAKIESMLSYKKPILSFLHVDGRFSGGPGWAGNRMSPFWILLGRWKWW